MKKGILICGFAGIGKSSIKEAVPYMENLDFYDLSSSSFRKDEGWEKVYVDCAYALANNYDYVFMSTNTMVIDELIARGKNFYIVYPKKQCKEEYFKRFMMRGDSNEYIVKFMKNWDYYIDYLDEAQWPNKISLRTGQYLSDVITRLR